jgi:hypothetical protein
MKLLEPAPVDAKMFHTELSAAYELAKVSDDMLALFAPPFPLPISSQLRSCSKDFEDPYGVKRRSVCC